MWFIEADYGRIWEPQSEYPRLCQTKGFSHDGADGVSKGASVSPAANRTAESSTELGYTIHTLV